LDKYGQCPRCSLPLANQELERLKARVATLEAYARFEPTKQTPHEIRLYVNGKWKNTFSTTDRIELLKHKYLSKEPDERLFVKGAE
jgi:hypothetical protein